MEVGSIEEIRRDQTPVDSAAAVLLTAAPAYARKPARPNDALHVRELVELLEPYYVRATLDYGQTRSRLFAGSSGAHIATVELQRSGAYEILADRVDPLSGLELRIRHGVVVVEHAAGRLDTWVSGTLMQVFGTTILFAADSTATEAYCFLQEGHVTFPAYGIDLEGRDVAWRLRDGHPPERLRLGAAERKQFRREVEFLSSDVWRGPRPFYLKPGFYLPVGAAVIGAGILLLTAGGDRASGEAIIQIPD